MRTYQTLVILAYALFFVKNCLCSEHESGSSKAKWNATYTDKLKRALLLNYDKYARPSEHDQLTVVNMSIVFRHVDIDELKSMFNVHAWVRMKWNDDKLKWNSSEFGDLTNVHMAPHELWQPDIVLYNSGTGNYIEHYGSTHCIVYDSGEVLWVPPAQFSAFCELNLAYWPFDTQKCILKFGSWTLSGNEIDLKIWNKTEVLLTVHNNEWDIVKVETFRHEKYYSCCAEAYIDITYNVTIARHSPTYRNVVISPAFVIMFLTLCIFWFPPQAGEKIILNGFTAIIVIIFLTYFAQKLPAVESQTPYIILFYSNSLCMICFSTIIAIIVICISRTQHTRQLPRFIKDPLVGKFGRCLGLGEFISTSSTGRQTNAEELRDHQSTGAGDDHCNTSDDHQMITSTPKHVPQQDWILLALAIDRICFGFYTFIFLIFIIIYSL